MLRSEPNPIKSTTPLCVEFLKQRSVALVKARSNLDRLLRLKSNLHNHEHATTEFAKQTTGKDSGGLMVPQSLVRGSHFMWGIIVPLGAPSWPVVSLLFHEEVLAKQILYRLHCRLCSTINFVAPITFEGVNSSLRLST